MKPLFVEAVNNLYFLTIATSANSPALNKFMGMIEGFVNFLTSIVKWGFTIWFAFIIVVNLFLYFQKASDREKHREAKEKLLWSFGGLVATWVISILLDVLVEVGVNYFGG